MAWPGIQGWGGGGMIPWGGGGGMPGFGNPWRGGGGMPGMGHSGPKLGPLEPYLNPTLPCTGATGMPLNLTKIDTGASISVINQDAFMRHFNGRVGVDPSKKVSLSGIGGQSQNTLGRFFTMNHNLRTDTGETVAVSGDCFIIPTNTICDVLMGMPYLIQNRMSLHWDPDFVEVQGKKVPIVMKASS